MEFFTIAEAARQIAAKAISPVELTQHCLTQTKKLNPTLHAFVHITEERALADARAAETRVMQRKSYGKLDGIPIAHKDIYNTAGIPTTACSRLLQGNVPTEDATAVARLAQAGTAMLGKLTTQEFAWSGPCFDLPWPPARNPWNIAHTTNGSSNGTAAAVAAGMVLGGTGSDTSGSTRGPAAFCGLAGIKPTYGLCSRAGILPVSFSLDHPGLLAWTAEDCALLLQAMAGHDPVDPASADRLVPDFSADLARGAEGLRIGVVRQFHEVEDEVDESTGQGIDDAIATFAGLGAEIRDVKLPPLSDYCANNYVIVLSEAYAVHEPWLKSRFNDYGEVLRNSMVFGGLLRTADYVQAQRRRRELCAKTVAAMQDVDILLTATVRGEAPKLDGLPKWRNFERPGFVAPWNLTGQPAISICSGFGPSGLPLAIQLIAKPFDEPTLFRAAHAFEQATAWRDRRPALAVPHAV